MAPHPARRSVSQFTPTSEDQVSDKLTPVDKIVLRLMKIGGRFSASALETDLGLYSPKIAEALARLTEFGLVESAIPAGDIPTWQLTAQAWQGFAERSNQPAKGKPLAKKPRSSETPVVEFFYDDE